MRLQMIGAALDREGQRLLGPIDLDLREVGAVALMGPNGAGKSLFLRLAHGILPASAGDVLWDGAPAMQTRSRRGFVFQATALLRRSTYENVAFPLRVQGRLAKERYRVDEALEQAGLSDKATQPAATLSGGEKQRMALARALVIRPKVILLDEPSAHLDPEGTESFEAMLAAIRATGSGLIMATHDIAQARRVADHVLVLEQGKLAQSAPAETYWARQRIG